MTKEQAKVVIEHVKVNGVGSKPPELVVQAIRVLGGAWLQ